MSASTSAPRTFETGRSGKGEAGTAPSVLLDAPLRDLAPDEVLNRLWTRFDRVPLEALVEDPRLVEHRWYRAAWTPRFRFAKRAFDLVVGAVLALLAMPVIAVCAIAIPLDSRGPVIYSQVRIGKDKKRFRIYKLRTMTVDAEANGAVYAAKNDPRVTRLGRFLRRTRLDELPQLVNVLKGDMSLIGPRPERPENERMLEDALPGFTVRTLVRPGLTGWAQIKAPYANTTEQTGKKLEYDLYYMRNASMSLDLKIAVKTVRVMLGSAGQ